MSTNVPGHEGIGRVVQGKCVQFPGSGTNVLTIISGPKCSRGDDGEARRRQVSFLVTLLHLSGTTNG
jgi:D-arabinose 1-dehydrogenase-like Zn-dependent alcohol dehydrogenase